MEALIDRQTNEQPAVDDNANGSIADVVARLSRWGRIAPHGLVRVEFISEFSRQLVVSRLREHLSQLNIPFYEIELPEQTPAEQIVTDLKVKFQLLEPGVVSLSGFETAFPDDVPLLDSLSLLNFNRENLADHSLRQIWWMTPFFAQEVVQSSPDLDSWFIVKLHLQESVYLPHQSIMNPGIELNVSVDKQEAYFLAALYVERFHKAVETGSTGTQVVELALYALEYLIGSGDIEEASNLEHILFQELDDAGFGLKAYLLSEVTTPEEAYHKIVLLSNLGALYNTTGRYAEAEPLLLKAMNIVENQFALDDPNLSLPASNLSVTFMERGRYKEAEALSLRLLNLHRDHFGIDSVEASTTLNHLALLKQYQGEYDEAEELYKQSFTLRRDKLGNEHPYTLTVLANYQSLLRHLGREKEAASLHLHSA